MDWSVAFFKDADKKDIDALAPWFGEKITVRIGNSPLIEGREAVTETFRQFYKSIAAMQHTPDSVIVDGDSLCSTATVTYTRLDGSKVSMPVASLLHRDAGGKLDKLHIYIDINPLFAAPS
ncbi:MAG: nuclear transport factor 2 family protein [Stellaceae bacterium]